MTKKAQADAKALAQRVREEIGHLETLITDLEDERMPAYIHHLVCEIRLPFQFVAESLERLAEDRPIDPGRRTKEADR